MYKILQALERPIYLNLLKRMVSEMGSGSNSTNKIIWFSKPWKSWIVDQVIVCGWRGLARENRLNLKVEISDAIESKKFWLGFLEKRIVIGT